MKEKRFGRQTPTVGFTLPYAKTLGDEAVSFYEASGRSALEWQKLLINDILAVDDEGLFIHSRFGYSVPRQNGKNEVIAIREMFGLFNGERMLHTAHRTATSRAAWERLVMLVEAAGVHEIKGENPSGYRSGKSKGQEWIQFDEEHGGGKCSYRTRSTTGGLGETFDLLIIDEAQEYQDDQASALKYTIVSSRNPQTIYLGTPPTPYSSGTLFPKFRKDTLTRSIKNAGWAEWSIEDKCDVNNVEAWYQTNPSLGYTLTERAIEDEIGEDSDDFNVQRLGLWISYNQRSVISRKDWDAHRVTVLPDIVTPLTVGIKFNHNGETYSVSIAGKTADDIIFTECVAHRQMRDGIDWVLTFLKECGKGIGQVIADGQNGIDLLTKGMRDAELKPPMGATVKNVIDANAAFEAMLYGGQLVHMEQPTVTQVVTNVERRPIGSQGGSGYKSTVITNDISIMDSVILAAWGTSQFKPKRRQRVSY